MQTAPGEDRICLAPFPVDAELKWKPRPCSGWTCFEALPVYGLKHPEATLLCMKRLSGSVSGGQVMMVVIIYQIYKKKREEKERQRQMWQVLRSSSLGGLKKITHTLNF